MPSRYTIYALTFVMVMSASVASADYEKIIVPTPAGSVKTFQFQSPRGQVTFNHDLHVKVMKNEACLPCHRTSNPTPKHIESKFEERTAHNFCRGCHRKSGAGPTECHECHRKK